MNSPQVPGLAHKAAALLKSAGIEEPVQRVSLANAGGNNRLYKIETLRAAYALKQYFRHAGDNRNRLASEFSFLQYASNVTNKKVPKPYAKDDSEGIALYEFLDGEPLGGESIGLDEVNAAIEFFADINDPGTRRTATQIPTASEASFSISEHLRSIDGRISQLTSATEVEGPRSVGHAEVRNLAEVWRKLGAWVRSESRGLGLDIEEILPVTERCISPSDFGFHNAIRVNDGRFCFLDFEYAGWDDPAKTVADFFSQLAVPVPVEYFDRFATGISESFERQEELIARIGLLRSVYQVKWCCIALNVFLPVHLARRKFANPDLDETFLKQTQLAKAKKILQSLQEPAHGLH